MVLGAPFDLVVGLQPDSGSDLAASCVSAQLHAGDRRIEASRVRITPLASGQAVRVQSSYTVDEPVMTLKLLAGCQGAMSRTYTLLPQLPEAVQSAGAARAGNPINVAQLASAGATSEASEALAGTQAGAGPQAAAAAPAATGRSPSPARAAARTPAQRDGGATAPRPQAKAPAQPRPQARVQGAKPNKARDAAAAVATTAALSGAQPLRLESRLRMEPVEDWLGTAPKAAGSAEGGEAASGAAAPAPWQVADATAEQLEKANQRVQGLETEIAALKKRDGADRAQLAQMRAELDAMRQESGSASWLFNALLLALGLALAAIAWLAWRLRQGGLSREQQAWQESVERSSQAEVAAGGHFMADDIDTIPSQPQTRAADLQGRAKGKPVPAPASRSSLLDRRGPDTMASPYMQRGAQMQPGVTYELQEDVDPGDFGPATVPVGVHADSQPAVPVAPASAHATVAAPVSAPASMPAPAPFPTRATAPAPLQAQRPEPMTLGVDMALPPTAPTPLAEPDKLRRMVQPEQLFDVQQQAEFFTSVGEHQQAIELLRAHIDAHEDSSPLAYLELLHLYYTLSRREDYDQLRQRFSRHFNGRVPPMVGLTDKGGSLLQAYPEQLARIEALWPTDEVEECLAHYLFKEDGAAAQDAPPAFDLAAFDELLLLLSIVRSTSAASRGSLQGRARTTPQLVPAPMAVAAASLAAGPATASLDEQQGPDALLFPAATPAAGAGRPATDLDAGLEFTPPDILPLRQVPVSAPVPMHGPDSLSAPLEFDMQQLDFAIDKVELPSSAQMRSMPLAPGPKFRDSAPSLLDIDLNTLGEEELPEVDVPSRFPPVSLPLNPTVGFSDRNLKAPLDMDLQLESWEPAAKAAQPPQGLDDRLSGSVDMLLSRETDPVFRRSPEPAPADGTDPAKPKS
ncbi:MAG: hypothetical protein LBJ40_00535 [Delftia acidovorans]|nr:hypothetical protein [Delftia acidovorans]